MSFHDKFPTMCRELYEFEDVVGIGGGRLQCSNHIDDGDHIYVRYWDDVFHQWKDLEVGDRYHVLGELLFLYHDEPYTMRDFTRMTDACIYYTKLVEGRPTEYEPYIILGKVLLEQFINYSHDWNVEPASWDEMKKNIDTFVAEARRQEQLFTAKLRASEHTEGAD